MEKYLTIEEIIELNIIEGAKLVAGKNGLANKSKHIIVLETPDGLNWLKGGEILITAGYALVNNEKIKNDFVRIAYENGVVALFIKLGRFFGDIQESLLRDADKYKIPIFLLDKDANYTSITSSYYEAMFNKETEGLLEKNKAYFSLLNLQSKQKSIESIIKETSKITRLKIKFEKLFKLQDQDKNSLVYNIDINGLKGYLTVYDAEELNEFQYNCIKYSMALIKNILKIEQTLLLSQSISNKMITEILMEKENISKDFLFNLYNYLEWDKTSFYGINFKWINLENKANNKIRKIIEIKLNGKFLFTTSENTMIVFLPDIDIRKLLNYILSTDKKLVQSLKIGVSSKFSDLSKIKKAYDEAKYVTELSESKISYISEVKDAKFILNMLKNRDNLESIYTLLDPIFKYDQKNNTSLIETITAFADNNLSNKITAEKMHIHTETLRYRLEKIKELTGYDIHDSKDLMIILIAVSALKNKLISR